MKQERKRTRVIVCITLIALVITPLIEFGTSQNVAEQEQNITIPMPENTTIPENVTSRENVTELTETQPENLTDMTAPIITIRAPLNTTYNTTFVGLNYTINEPPDWVVYSLNGADNVTIMGNITFNARVGFNDLVVYATDTAGNLGKAEVQFTVKLTEPLTITPKLPLKLTKGKDCFALDEEPEFIVEYADEEEMRGIAAAKAESVTINAFVYGPYGELSDIEIEKRGENNFSVKIPRERAFRAGLYKLGVKLVQNGETYTREQDFTWGVLVLNTHKSIYLPDENAFIGIAVLDNAGHMVCDADVTLIITDPDNKETVLSTSNGLIKVSPECSVYGVTNLPDYYTNYTVGGVGTYVMNLTAITPAGTKSITDNFTVQSSVDFDVARDGPTRIYPRVPYVMNLTIKANKDYEGFIREYVPASFGITPQNGLAVTTVGDTKILTWDKYLDKGEIDDIYYEFDAPDISPYLFSLGELGIGDWKEARQWQIASDSPDTVTLRPNGPGSSTQWTIGGSSPAPTNWESVDETTPDDDVTDVETTTVGNKDLYNLMDSGLSGATINNVTVWIRLKKLGGSITDRTLIRTYGTDYEGGDIYGGTTWTNYSTTYTTNPNTTAAWTIAEVDALQAGVVHKKGTQGSAVTQVWVVVDYTISNAPFVNAANVTVYDNTSDVNTENWINFTIQDPNTMDDIKNITVEVWYANSTANPYKAASNNNRSYCLFKWNDTSDDNWHCALDDAYVNISGHITEAMKPSGTETWQWVNLSFKLNQTAVPSGAGTQWNVSVTVYDLGGLSGTALNATSFDVNKYVSAAIQEAGVNLGTVAPGNQTSNVTTNMSFTSNTQVEINVTGANLWSGSNSIGYANFYYNATDTTKGGSGSATAFTGSAQVAYAAYKAVPDSPVLNINITGWNYQIIPALAFNGTIPIPQITGNYTGAWNIGFVAATPA